MTDPRPVFVIHGIGNRDRAAVAERVARLSAAAFDRWPLHSVYWGDLGASTLGVDLAVPPGPGQRWDVRGDAGPAEHDAELMLGGPVPLRPADRLELVQAAAERLLDAPPVEVRGVTPDVAQEVRAAIAAAWPQTRWLRYADDPTLLGEVGAALAGAVLEAAGDDVGGHEVRDPGRVRQLVRRHLPELDRVAGAAVGAAGERFYTWVRVTRAERVALTLGDVLVYQRHGERIRQRIREQIAAVAGADGERAVHLVGHSLGAVIALDLATGEDPVRTAGLVTFGCQWPLLHLFDPRGGQLAAYDGTGPVLLPRSLGRWTNLWHPLDPLGFVASRLFRLHDGRPPRDVRVAHLLSDALYTHSEYWGNPQLASALHETFADDGEP
ncbi:hypothetical protein [Micromonospora sp. DT233]|uniref:hypothetical protein n=1 Tax=Micromonospora sp. DT233 TaxID=3393432 RepID=UPI003CF92F1F